MQNRVVDKWRQRADEFAEKIGKWKACLPELEKESANFRKEILDLYFEDEVLAVSELKTVEPLATMPIFIHVIKDLKRVNDNQLRNIFAKIGLELPGEDVTINEKNPEEKVVDHFKPWIQKDIVKSFRDFIMWDKDAFEFKDKDQKTKKIPFERNDYELLLTQLTVDLIQKKLDSNLMNLFVNLCAVYPEKINALNANKEELFKYLRVEFFLICALRTYIGSDNAQKLNGFLEKLGFIMHYEHGTQIRKPFLLLTFATKGLEYSKEANLLWQEFNLYLQGFYHRILARDPNKVDKQDVEMQKHLHVSKRELSEYNNTLSKQITPHLLPKEELRPRKTTPVLPFFSNHTTFQGSDEPIARPPTPARG